MISKLIWDHSFLPNINSKPVLIRAFKFVLQILKAYNFESDFNLNDIIIRTTFI